MSVPTTTQAAPKKDWKANLPVQVFKNLPANEKKATIAQMLQAYSRDFARALPKFMTPERYYNTMLMAVTRNPGLLECDPLSLLKCWMHAAMLGLEPDTPQQHCHTVPFYNSGRGVKEAVFITGYRGMVELAYRSERVASIEARVVFDCDEFSYGLGDNPYIAHKPSDKADPKTRKVTHAYAVIRLKGSEHWPIRDVMSVAEIEEVRAMSKGANSFGWKDHYPAMCVKTVLRRALKLIPNSREVARAMMLDDTADNGEQPDPFNDLGDVASASVESESGKPEDPPQPQRTTRSQKVADKIADKAESKPSATESSKPTLDQLKNIAVNHAGFSEVDLTRWVYDEYGCSLEQLNEVQLASAIKALESFK